MIAVRSRDGVRANGPCVYVSEDSEYNIFHQGVAGISKPKDLEGRKLAYTPGDRVMFPAFALANAHR